MKKMKIHLFRENNLFIIQEGDDTSRFSLSRAFIIMLSKNYVQPNVLGYENWFHKLSSLSLLVLNVRISYTIPLHKIQIINIYNMQLISQQTI